MKWADHFGKSIEVTLNADGDDAVEGAAPAGTSVSGSDWKKRDRLREKEMLANAKYVKGLVRVYELCSLF